MERFDCIVLGAGGAGMMCATEAAKRGRRVLILDHSKKVGGKILISGGGRCNFTNLGANATNYVSENPHFCKSALSRFSPGDFIQRVQAHKIAFHEKKLGQLFCDDSAQNIVDLLVNDAKKAGVEFLLATEVQKIQKQGDDFFIQTHRDEFECKSLVVATGGLSIPKIGATGFGHKIAKDFGLKVTPLAPALDGFDFSDTEVQSFRELSGISIDVILTSNGVSFRENILFTHSGLSGPAALQGSLHWKSGDPVSINFLPDLNLFQWLFEKKRENNRSEVKNLLAQLLPKRFCEKICENEFRNPLPLVQIPDKQLQEFSQRIHKWDIYPKKTVGYNKAEVTRGGVDTNELSSKTMEAKKIPGLYFIGEVVDVTGWLGGYNFQWAWASGWAAGQAL